ncbi:pumilio domain-containing protein KIAA0020 homolog [Elysia marginata]|uniref:Pumilio domain-containing protein KIAA0020 homolog n=1 Tax=Elysia marginata TaxID=1093978 RepID=A0AAV4HVE3_9GAST|nr:pumilio domain-containing protein KIAA0020 homolog [Elysia marginata]
MKGKTESPAKSKATVGNIRHGGFGVTKKSASKQVSMTPDRFERSQNKAKKYLARRSLYNADDTTQVHGSLADISQADDSALELTPVTISQISAIDIPANDTLTATFRRKKRRAQNDDTLEMAVQCARGEPDGAERSFTRRQFEKFSLADDEDDGNEENGGDMDESMEVDEMENDDEADGPSPVKKSKNTDKKQKDSPGKTKKIGLKEPLKQAAKKLKKLKSAGDQKAKKGGKNFDALPDETTVPKTPNQTWKEKRQERRMTKNNYDLISTAKKSWEELRRGDLPAVKRKKICDDLMGLTRGKVKEVYDICDLCKSKYAKFVVRKLISYGSKDLKGRVFQCFYGQIRKLIKHKEASEIIEYAYNEFATAPQRMAIHEEFYGPTFSLFKNQVYQSLDQIMTEQPEKRDMVVRSMKETLTPLIDKDLLSYSLVHKVFLDFFVYADDKSKKEMIESLREHIPSFLHTRDGTRVAMHCIWAGSAKDRKTSIKSLKTHVAKACMEEQGHLLLLAIFDSVDDTVLVQKVILDELLKSLDTLIVHATGKKVLLYLLNPRDPVHFNPNIQQVLQEGDCNPTSKKDKAVRAKELRTYISPHAIKYLEHHALEMMSDNALALVVKAIITYASGDVSPAMRAIADLVAKPCSTADGAINMVEHPASHIALKKIIANDKTRLEAGEGILFSSILLEALPKSTIKVWAASNRGCFILVSLLDVGCSTVTENVKASLQPVMKSLRKMTFKGAEILLERLDKPRAQREYRV